MIKKITYMEDTPETREVVTQNILVRLNNNQAECFNNDECLLGGEKVINTADFIKGLVNKTLS
jgi:hypothetical protein